LFSASPLADAAPPALGPLLDAPPPGHGLPLRCDASRPHPPAL